MYKILIAEDEKDIAKAVEIYLKNQGYTTCIVENGALALEVLKEEAFDLAIIDVMMPIMDGISLTMKLRESYDFPIIILSAKSEDIDKITGLNIGADDYICKPFVPMELLARVNAQLRRYERYTKHIKEVTQKDVLLIGGIELHKKSKRVIVDGVEKKLTPIEFKILELFMEQPGRVFSCEEIYESVWNERAIATETVMVHIRNLREKIEIDFKKPRYIKVVWGVGYKIEKP